MTPPAQEKKLAGRVAVISGGAQGIGKAIAERFQDAGASVVLLDCDRATGNEAVRQLTDRQLTDSRPSAPAILIHADLSDPGQIRQAVDDLKNKHGRLDVLVNNAGIELDKSFDQVSTCEWDRILN